MAILSRRSTPAFLLFLAVCACGDVGVENPGAPDGGMPGAGADAAPNGPDAGGNPDGGLPDPGWPDPDPPPPAFAPVYLVTDDNELALVSAEAAATVLSSKPLTGLAVGEQLLGIDFRPATGELYGLGSTSRLYVIDPETAAASPIGAAPFTPALNGTVFGFDFNPTVDRIRVVSDAGQNLRLHPVTGAVAGEDTPLAYDALDPGAGGTPAVNGSAYTASFLGSTRTTLYGIDITTDALVRQGSDGGAPTSPNTGALFTVGALGFDATGVIGFDIGDRDAAFAALATAAGAPELVVINLASGAAVSLGALGDGRAIRGVAVPPPAPPTVYALTETNKLIGFKAGAPGVIIGWVPLTGLDSDAVGIDFRPATGELFALTASNRVYRIELATGAATAVGDAPFTPGLNGTSFGFDFNPTVDRIRVVTDARQNMRLNPQSGAAAGLDTALTFTPADPNAGVPPRVVGSAYTGNFLGSTRTTLYGIDTGKDVLIRQGSIGGAPTSPNIGTIFTVGSLGLDASSLVGFDIAARDAAFAALTPEGEVSSSFYIVNLASGAAVSLGAIGGGERARGVAIPPPAPPTVYAVTEANQLLTFSAGAPGAIASTTAVSGLAASEKLLGLDIRPATGQLFALGSGSRVYRIDPTSRQATAIGLPLVPPIEGDSFAFDFNPTVDRIRVVGDRGDNLRFHPVTGALAGTDTDVAYDAADPGAGAPTRVVGAAYTQSFLGSTRTTLFDIDAERDVLVRQGSEGGSPVSPNAGTLFTVGPLGVNASDLAGLDIGSTGAAFAVLTPAGSSTAQLYVVNLTTGGLTSLGPVASTSAITAAALAP